MSESTPGYLRLRVVNPRVSTLWSENFESTNSTNQVLWHSIGTEAGTDGTLNYWTSVSGSWSLASNLVTTTAAAGILTGGHADWTDGTFRVRFKWATGNTMGAMLHYVDSNNFIAAIHNGTLNTDQLFKKVAGVETVVNSVADTLVNGTFYWLEIVGSGTSYTANFYNDSAGALGTRRQTLVGTISDAAVQTGMVGLNNRAAVASTWGGAFNNVCQFTGITPNFWTPVVTTGEPAFANSKVAPQAGTFSASIFLANSAGSGSWQQATTLAATQPTTQTVLQAQIKASAGTANVSGGGLTTPNGTSFFANQTVTGTMTANPTVACNYSGAVGTAYFDSLSLVSQGIEVTAKLPHLHQATFQTVAMQPGNPSNSAIGSATVALYPPGTGGYAAAKATYDQLDYFQRVEFYVSHDGSVLAGNPCFAGVITGIAKEFGGGTPRFELDIESDVWLGNRSRPFPGELLSNDTSDAILKSYLGTNELGWADNFSTFTAANYTSTTLPTGGFTSGTWSGTTDDGLTVATCSTGSGAVLLSKTGAVANDRWHTHYVEAVGRLVPTSSSSNAGSVGVGLSQSNANTNNSIVGRVIAVKDGSRYQLTAQIISYVNGAQSTAPSITSVLTNVDDPNGKIPLTVGLLVTTGGNASGTANASLTVNGRVVIGQSPTNLDPGPDINYPFLFSGSPAGAVTYLTNLTQQTRFTVDGPSSAAVFGAGSITGSSNSLTYGIDPGPTFLDAWTRLATREGWYWRYTPQAYTIGTRTLGTVDYAASPGTDRSTSIRFKEEENLVSLALTANADTPATDTATSSQSTGDSGGIIYWRDLPNMQKYGLIADETLSFTYPDFNSQRRAAFQIVSNKTQLVANGSKIAVVERDAKTADKWRELDKVMVHCPTIGINYQSALVLTREFTESDATEVLQLDQFSSEPTPHTTKRLL